MNKRDCWRQRAAGVLALGAMVATAAHGELLNGNGKISARAHGTYAIAGTTADITLKAKEKDGREATGNFRHTLVFQGLLIDFVGDVTCMAVDMDNGRAWIGGVVTENNSDHPGFTTEIHQPGHDIWFRVLDTGASDDADRTTFVGFEGGADIPTSAEYCRLRIWPGPPDDEPNARTSPLSSGHVKIKPLDDAD